MANTKSHISKESSGLDSTDPDMPKKDASVGVHLAETAWRIAVPFFVLMLGGVWIDSALEKSPIFTLLGTVLAVIVDAVIVYRYVDKNFPETFKKQGKK